LWPLPGRNRKRNRNPYDVLILGQKSIKRNFGKFEGKKERDGIDIKIHWSPGHGDINGNEIADRLAKDAAK